MKSLVESRIVRLRPAAGRATSSVEVGLRAAQMRSGRDARIALTAATVTTASPMAISACTPSIADSTVASGTVPESGELERGRASRRA